MAGERGERAPQRQPRRRRASVRALAALMAIDWQLFRRGWRTNVCARARSLAFSLSLSFARSSAPFSVATAAAANFYRAAWLRGRGRLPATAHSHTHTHTQSHNCPHGQLASSVLFCSVLFCPGPARLLGPVYMCMSCSLARAPACVLCSLVCANLL